MRDDDRRLIEDYLPIEAISKEASREKSVRKGHISTLHLWWARRPLVACRAAVYGALVPASRFRPANGPEEKRDSLTRANAAKFVERLCKYPGSPQVIAEAQQHILEAHAERLTRETGKPVTVQDIVEGRAPRPKVLDMFAGGGSIPLEALRLGCEAYALDLNPVAHIIELCTLVYPQKYGKPDQNVPGMTGPGQAGGLSSTWGGLAEEVRYWGNWVLEKVKAEIGDLYPLIPDPRLKEKGGRTGVSPVIKQGELFQTRRHLPHWQIGASVYFVTFSTRKIPLPEHARQIVLNACRYWHDKRIRLHLACIMPDHVHALIEPLETSSGEYFDLSQVLHSIKSYTAHEINTLLKRTGPLWEEESWDRIIRDENDYREKWEYILNNPIKAGLCDKGESYPFLWSEGDRPEVCPPSLPQVPPGYLVPVAYLWTRTVRCKNPTCGATVPLVRQTWLCKKKDRYVALKMIAPKGKKQVRFEVVESRTEKGLGFDPAGFSKGGNATCPFCRTVADSDYVKAEGCAKRLGNQLMAVAATRSTTAGKLYLSRPDLPVGGESEAAILHRAETLALKLGITVPSEVLEPNPRSFDVQYFGFTLWRDVFTPRQLLAMTCFAGYIRQAHAEIARAVVRDDAATAVVSCLSMALGRLADYCTSFCTWQPEFVAHMFDSPGLPMIMDFAEANPLVDSSGSWPSAVDYVTAALEGLVTPSRPAAVVRGSAMSLPWPDEAFDAIVTDPPYYDSRTYSNLADHFYVWHKRSIGHIYPEHFASELTPKKTEAIAARYRHAGSKEDADRAYENMMEEAFKECNRVLRPGMPLVCVYAHKTTSGWSTVINALMKAGFVIVEAWPVEMERKVRQNAQETAALASSILLVARKRHEARTGSYDEEVRPDLESIVRERVDSLWKMGITGADLVIAAVGAGLRAYTRFSRVEYANGEEVPAQKFLAEVEGVVLETLLEKIFGMPGSGVAAVDGPSRFYVLWRYAYKAAEMDAGEAIVFTYGQNVELDGPKGLSTGRYALVEKKKGKYRLRDFTERGEDEKLGLPEDGGTPPPLIDALHRILWLVENQPRSLNKFLDEARPDRERLRLLAQALAGTALEGGHPSRLSDGPDGRDARRPSGTTPAEQAALKKLLANWRAVIDQRLAELPLFATEEKR